MPSCAVPGKPMLRAFQHVRGTGGGIRKRVPQLARPQFHAQRQAARQCAQQVIEWQHTVTRQNPSIQRLGPDRVKVIGIGPSGRGIAELGIREKTAVDRRHINTGSDTEVLINVLAHELEQVARDLPLTPDAVSRPWRPCTAASRVPTPWWR